MDFPPTGGLDVVRLTFLGALYRDRLSSSGSSGRGVPLSKGCRSEGSQGLSGDEVALEIEGIVDCAVGGNKALSLALGLEPLHFPFPSSDGEVGIFDPVVVT